MRNRGAVVAVIVMCLSCFSTARYDRAHIQRVASINGRHDAALERERERYAFLVAELDWRRALVIPIDAGGAPVHRVDRRDGIVACRTMCGAKPGDPFDPARAHTRCLRDICLPAYADALAKTYAHADIAGIASQLSLSIDADLESVLARANNQAVLADIDREAAVLAQHHARARSRIEQQRQRELRVSTVQRDAEIAAGRAARRARVKAAADAFAAEARGQPGASAIASHTTVPDPSGAARPRDCADPPCRPPLPAPSSVTCISDGDNTVAHATDPATARTSDPASTPPSVANTSPSTPPDRPPSRPPNRPLNRPSNRPPDCIDQRDCPSGMSCDLDTGVCCATIVR
jgi:hypothetical protein